MIRPENIVRSRIAKCRRQLKRRDLPKTARWQWLKNLYYWYGFLDGMSGDKP